MNNRRAIKQNQHLDINTLTVELCTLGQGIWPYDVGFTWFNIGLGRPDEPEKKVEAVAHVNIFLPPIAK